MTIRDKFGICMYNWYGGGGHQSPGPQPYTVSGFDLVNADGKWISTIRAIGNFKLHRAFVDNYIVVPESAPPFTLKTNPTEQNFWFDEFFKLQKANGITNIWSASGCFDWYKGALATYSQRKTACYNPNMAPTDPAAWQDLAQLCAMIAQRYAGTGLLDYLQVLNEYDFRWNVPHILTPEEYAVGFKVCYEAIRAVAPAQKIMIGATLTPDVVTAKRFFGQLDQLRSAEGKPVIRDVTYSANNYIRTESNNQGNGIGATPEEVDRYGVFFKPLADFLAEIGCDGAMLTEAGWSNTTSTSASGMKNKAPALQGFSIDQAQGILAIRLALILASIEKWHGVTFYHCRDEYEAEPFTYNGFNRKDWSAKEVRLLSESFLTKYGDYTASDFRKDASGIYYVTLTKGSDVKTLHWSDKVNIGTATPMPQETTVVPPPVDPPPPPQPSNMIIGYSNKVDRSDFAQLTANANIPAGFYFVEARQATPTVSFSLKKDGIVVKTQSENGAPFDLAGGQPYNFSTGDYELTVKDKTTPAGIVIQFTVGTVAPPPPPPPTQEPVTETYIESGKVFFKTATKTYSTPVT